MAVTYVGARAASTGGGATSITNWTPGGHNAVGGNTLLAAGDLMLWVLVGTNNTAPATPSGWAVWEPTFGSSGLGVTVFSRTATASEADDFTATVATGRWTSQIVAFRGYDTATPQDTANVTGSNTTGVDVSQTITTVTQDAMVLAFDAGAITSGTTAGSWTAVNMTRTGAPHFSGGVSTNSGSGTQSSHVGGYTIQSTPGSFTPSFNPGTSSFTRRAAITIALRPPTTGGSVTVTRATTWATAGPPLVDTLTDGFDVLDSAVWETLQGTPSVVSGRLNLPNTYMNIVGDGGTAIRSVDRYSLAGSSLTFDVALMPSAGWSNHTRFYFIHPTNFGAELGYRIEDSPGEIYAIATNSGIGGFVTKLGATYDSLGSPRYLRIRETAGTVFWEYATDADPDTWTALHTAPTTTTPWIGSGKVLVNVFTVDPSDPPSPLRLNRVNAAVLQPLVTVTRATTWLTDKFPKVHTPAWVWPGGYVEVTFSDDGNRLMSARSYVPAGYTARVTLTTRTGDETNLIVGAGWTNIPLSGSATDPGTRVGIDLIPT